MKSKKILLVQTNYPGFLTNFENENKSLSKYQELKAAWDSKWFGQGNFYSLHLNKLGWNSEEIIANSFLMQSSWMKDNGYSLNKEEPFFTKYLPESIKNILHLRQWVKDALFTQIKHHKPDVVYMHDLTLLNLDEVREVKKYTKLLAGQIACPLPLDQRPLHHYDLLISSFPHYVDLFRSWGVKSEYLRWCFEDSINKELKSGPKKYDCTFIGGYSNAHSKGNSIFEKIASKTKVDFWGYGAGSLSPNSKIKETYHGEIWGKDMYQVMRDSRIVINRHINVAGNIANNMRMFDVTGVGSLLLTDDKPNMDEFFDVDTEVVTYTSANDLVKKIKYYLKNPKELEKIAKRGQSRTLKEHTYKLRMKELSNILESHI